MAPPNFFRFVAKAYVDSGPTEDNPRYANWNNQYYYRSSGGYTYNISNFTTGSTGSFVGDIGYNSSNSYNATYYLQANGEDNALDLRSGSIVWEFQPDADNGYEHGSQVDWGFYSHLYWHFRPMRLSDDSFHGQFVRYTPGNYNSNGYYEHWLQQLYRGANPVTNPWSVQFHSSNALRRKPSDFQFRYELRFEDADRTLVTLRAMYKHTGSAVSWDDISSGAQQNLEYFGGDTFTQGFTATSDDQYKFYPGIYVQAKSNPGAGPDLAAKYFKMWYGNSNP